MWRWLTLLVTAQMVALITSESLIANRSSLYGDHVTRTVATSCKLDIPNCFCSMQPVEPEQAPPPYPCIWDAVTCECGWDVAGLGVYTGVGPAVPADKTCVVDARNCLCLVGSLPLEPEVVVTPVNIEEILTNVDAQINAIHAQVAPLLPTIRNVAEKPIGAVVALSFEQREKLIEEPVSVLTQLKEVAGNKLNFENLHGGEKEALMALLREENVYLGKLRNDTMFMIGQLGKTKVGEVQPMVVRLRKVLAELEIASRKAPK